MLSEFGGRSAVGFGASSLATIPSEGFEWWVLILEDSWNDALRDELTQNFETLSRQVGPNVLVVRGFDPDRFAEQAVDVLLQGLGYRELRAKFPALVLTNVAPGEAVRSGGILPDAKVILLPLRARYHEANSTIGILQEVVDAVRNPDAMDALEHPGNGKFRRYWSWLPRYLELKPNFMGFGLNLNTLIDDVFRSPQPYEAVDYSERSGQPSRAKGGRGFRRISSWLTRTKNR